ncbi:Vacuolar protein sorting-associated protein 11 [Batrachochytrium dendrobatidis]|nr:Vacuolar protein sorting-associated protein 11 [Batrachochytrium dendrobatidis]
MTPGPSTNGSVAARPIGNIPFSPDRLNNSNKPAAPSDPIATTGGQWKQLSFFDKDEILQSSSITAQVATALETWLQTVQITSSASGRGFLVFGDILFIAFVSI